MSLHNKTPRGLLAAILFCLSAATLAQEFEPIGTINADVVAAGDRTIWAASKNAATTSNDTFLYNRQIFDFERKQPALEQFPAKILATGGGNIYQADESWALFQQHGLYRYDPGLQDWQKYRWEDFDPRTQGLVVGVGYSDNCHPYEVWRDLKDPTSGALYLSRFDYCAGLFFSIPTSSNMSRVATGGGEVWALDTSNRVYRYDGVARQFNLMPGVLSQIAVGVDGVWGINGGGQAFEFNAITQSWDQLTAPALDAIWAGGDGVFARQCVPLIIVGTLGRAEGGAVAGADSGAAGTTAGAAANAAADATAGRAGDRLGLPCQNQMMRYEPVTRRFVAITTPYQPDVLSVGSGAGALGAQPAMRWVMMWLE